MGSNDDELRLTALSKTMKLNLGIEAEKIGARSAHIDGSLDPHRCRSDFVSVSQTDLVGDFFSD